MSNGQIVGRMSALHMLSAGGAGPTPGAAHIDNARRLSGSCAHCPPVVHRLPGGSLVVWHLWPT